MRLVALLSGTVACLVLLVCVCLIASMAFMWDRDIISALLSATPKQLLFLRVWYVVLSLLSVPIFYLTWEYLKMLLGRRPIVKSAVWTGLAFFGVSFAISAHSGVIQFSSLDGLLSFLFAALFGGAIVANCMWLKQTKAAERPT